VKDIKREVISNAQTSTPVLRSVLPSSEQAREKELSTNVDEVSSKLQAMGHDPLEELARAAQDESLSLHQRSAINRWLMPYRYPQKRAVEITGKDGGAIPLVLSRDDDSL